MESQKLQTAIRFNKPQLFKKALQFLLFLSAFSFLFPYSSTFSFFVRSFVETIDRKYMFLLCNVILVFLAGNSGLITSPLKTDDFHDEFCRRNKDDLQGVSELSEKKASASEKEVVLESVGTPENALVVIVGGGGGGGNGCLITEEEENEHLIAVGGENRFLTAAAAEEEEEGNVLSTEELNKKCDDFIRWMKEGIKTEAHQRQLVMV